MNISESCYISDTYLAEQLALAGTESQALIERGGAVKYNTIGKTVHVRGLIELSNLCSKSCLYCGIRSGNSNVERYNLSDNEILDSVRFAYDNGYGSIALQAGELTDKRFIVRIDRLLRKIKQLSNNQIGITLSLGEQSFDTYRRWFESGAHRYLLRIETSNRELYKRLHPCDGFHDFDNRLKCLQNIKSIGYQTGTGVMIGLPFQSLSDLANDLLFMKNFGVDMVGMGPFVEHDDTPLNGISGVLPLRQRFELTLRMIALLRIIMPDINMVASTAMQTIDPMGREKAVMAGANIIMPNITPKMFRNRYMLYNNKPGVNEDVQDSLSFIEARLRQFDHSIGYEQWGDSLHFKLKRLKR